MTINGERWHSAALPQVVAVCIKNVLLLGYGMTLGFPTIVIPALQGGVPGEPLLLDAEQISWISSINLICVPVGCLLSGVATQPLGRKRAMQLLNAPFAAAWLLFHGAGSAPQLYAALCLTGLGGGLLEAPVITYVAEITQPHLRGMLSATSSMTIILGVFTQFLLGTFVPWRTVALLNLAVPLLAVLLLFAVPESPHWLVARGRLDEARAALAWLRGWTTPDRVDAEFRQLCRELSATSRAPAARDVARRFLERSFLAPYALVSFSFFLGHFSGMTTLQTFAVAIFHTLRAPIDKYYATLILGIVELLGSLLCVVAVHYVGKRPLTFLSTIGCGLCFIVVATYAYTIDVHSLATAASDLDAQQQANVTLQWLPTTFLIGSAFLSHTGIRLLPWILIGEVFPAQLRSIASGLAGGTGYVFGFAANRAFLSMVRQLTLPGTFWLYGVLSLMGTVILYFYLPETEGRTLVDIELHFTRAKRIKRNAGVHKATASKITPVGVINFACTDDKSTAINNENMESKL